MLGIHGVKDREILGFCPWLQRVMTTVHMSLFQTAKARNLCSCHQFHSSKIDNRCGSLVARASPLSGRSWVRSQAETDTSF